MRSSLQAVSGIMTLITAASMLGGCVSLGQYNSMLQQQQAIEASLRSEIAADQVKISELENGIRVTMSDALLYTSGSDALHANGRAALDKVAAQLANMAAQGNEVDVVGNTDDVPIGGELRYRYPSNWELAGARASLVVRYLQEKGVDPSKMKAISNGSYHPVASNATAAGRAQNRRTDLLLRPTN